MASIGYATVSIIPSAKNFGKDLANQVDPQLKRAGESGGHRLSGALGGVLKKSALGIGIAAGGILGTALFKGFERLSAIDQAEAKLTGLGNSAKTVSKIMDNALASVKGTAFGLGDAATVAAGAVASGVKPGKELTKDLKLVADAATIAGVPLNEMGAIFNKVAASGKIQGDVIAQLGDQGIPILQLLGKQIGKTPAEVSKLASKGKIDFKTFSAAMQAGLGGAALKSGGTFKGALANMLAALGRLGAGLLKGVFPIAKQVFGSLTVYLDSITAKVTPFADALSARLPGAFKAISAAIQSLVSGGGGKLAPLVDAVRGFAESAIQAGRTAAPALASIARGLLPLVKLAAGVAIVGLVVAFRALGPVLTSAATAFAAVTNFVKSNQTTFKVLAAIIGVALLPVLIQSTVAFIANAASVIATNAAWLIYGATTKAVAIATKVFTAGQWLLNAALTANPIGIVVVALAALAAGLIYAYKHSETFRNIVNSVFGFIRSHWPLLLGILTGPIGLAVLLIVKNFGRIRSAAAGVIDFFKSVPGKIKGAFGNVGSILADTGRKLIQGLINGITSKFGDVKNTLGGLTRKLTSWKGPAPLDKVILSPAGRMVIDGFITGLESRYSAVQSSLGGLTNSLGVPASPTISSRSTPSSPAGTHPIVLDGMVVGYLHGMVTNVVADQANLAATTGRQHR